MGIFPLVLFGPRVDKERESPFLPAEPTELIKKKQFQSVPYIMGVTQNEGVMMAAGNISYYYFLIIFKSYYLIKLCL